MPKANIIPVYDVNPRYSHQWKVESSWPGKWYTVSLQEYNYYECSCKGWTSHTPRQDCKHIKEVKQNDKAIADEIKQQVADAIKKEGKNYAGALERCPLCKTALQYSQWSGEWSCPSCESVVEAAKTLGSKLKPEKVKKVKKVEVETVKELFTQSKIKIR